MRRRPAAAALLCAGLLAGCGPESPLEVDLRSVSITVPRLVTPAVEVVPPGPPAGAGQLPPVPRLEDLLPPAQPVVVDAPEAPPVAPAPEACPRAGAFAVPAKPASVLLPGIPAAQTAVQTAKGVASAGGATTSLDGDVTTVIARLPEATSAAGQRVESWQVQRTDAKGLRSVEVYQLVHAGATASAFAPGIYLAGLAWDDPVRGTLTFRPTGGGVEVLPDPVAVVASGSAQYAGAATDPDSLTTLSIVRNVTGRKRVDVCGKLVDSFTVEITGVLTSPDAQYQLAWTQQVATQYGGVQVEDTLTLTAPLTGTTWTRTLRNQTVPADVR